MKTFNQKGIRKMSKTITHFMSINLLWVEKQSLQHYVKIIYPFYKEKVSH